VGRPVYPLRRPGKLNLIKRIERDAALAVISSYVGVLRIS